MCIRDRQYAEWDAQRKGTSYKQKLKIAIDRLIPISKDLDDCLLYTSTAAFAFVPYIGAFLSCAFGILFTLLAAPNKALLCLSLIHI